MLKNRLINALIVLTLGVAAFFTLQLASKGGTPADLNGRYAPAGQIEPRM